MLAYILAIAVGLGSFALYMAAFFFPEVHRKGDFIWSGVGLFYSIVLWFCAGRITGAVLLGQTASVALLGWFGWEMLRLRRELTPRTQRTEISASSPSLFKIPALPLPWKGKKDQIAADAKVPPSVPQSTTAGTQPVATVAMETETVSVPGETPTPEPIPAYEDVAPAAAETAEILEPVAEPVSASPTPPPAESIEALDELEFDIEAAPTEVPSTTEPPAAESVSAKAATPLPTSVPPSRMSGKDQSPKKSTGGGFASLFAPMTGLVSDIKAGVTGLLSKGKKSKSQPDAKKSTTDGKTAQPDKTVEKIATSEAVSAVKSTDAVEELGTITTEEPATPETITAGKTEDSETPEMVTEVSAVAAIPEQNPGDDQAAEVSESTTISAELLREKTPSVPTTFIEIAPEAELAPPAEEEVTLTAAYTPFDELQPLDVSETTAAESQKMVSEEAPELVRPNPPDPSLVEAAQREETISDSPENISIERQSESKSKDLEE